MKNIKGFYYLLRLICFRCCCFKKKMNKAPEEWKIHRKKGSWKNKRHCLYFHRLFYLKNDTFIFSVKIYGLFVSRINFPFRIKAGKLGMCLEKVIITQAYYSLWTMLKEIGIYKTAHRLFIFNNIQDAYMI